jgi:hypothetical protein
MANADGYVLPNPGIPKTLGILNVIFGVIFVLLGICGIGSLLAAPALVNFGEKIIKDAQNKVEAKNKASEKELDDRIAAAKSDEEKKALEQERDVVIANRPPINQVDFSAATDVFNNRTIMAYSYAGAISGLILMVVLLVSGIGLIRLAPWGRLLAVWWGGLQLVQIAILLAANLLILQPLNKPNTDKQIAKLEEAAKGKAPGSPEVSALQMTKIIASLAIPMAVGQSLGGITYPIIILIMLNTKAARAALLPSKPEGEGEF